MSKYLGLGYLLDGYFHQDFYIEHGSPEAAVENFVSSENDDIVKEAADDIANFLSEFDCESTAREQLAKLGSYYAPWQTGKENAVAWLIKIQDKLYDHLYY